MENDNIDNLKHNSCSKCVSSIGPVNVFGNSFVALAKMYLGFVGGSTALFADGIHSFGDVAGSMTMLVGLKVAKKPKNSEYPYGYGKFEYIAAAVIYTMLAMVGIYIFVMAVRQIVGGKHVNPDMVTMIGALISLVANELMYRQSICAGEQMHSPTMVANAHEKRADVWSSLAVLLGIAGAKLGFWFLDPLAALMVSGFIFKLCYESIGEANKGLLDRQMDEEDRSEIVEVIKEHAKVEMVSLRTREIGQLIDVEIYARAQSNLLLKEIDEIKNKLSEDILQKLGRKGSIEVIFQAN